MGNICSTTSSIEQDHKDLALLLESAKFGKWVKVWNILGSPLNVKKAYMINCCPEKSSLDCSTTGCVVEQHRGCPEASTVFDCRYIREGEGGEIENWRRRRAYSIRNC